MGRWIWYRGRCRARASECGWTWCGRPPALVVPLIGNVQHVPARLAVDSIRIVLLQAALWAGEVYLVGPEDRLRQAYEKRDADDHDDDRGQLAAGARQGDVAEAGGGHRCDSEVERVDVT